VRSILRFTYLEVLHQDGHDDIDEYKLRHEDEDDKKHWSDERADTTVANAVIACVAVISQRVLTNKIDK